MDSENRETQIASSKPLKLACAGIAALLFVAAAPVQAFKFEFGNDYSGSFDTTLSYGLQMRMQNRSCALIGRDNGGCAALNAALPEASEDAFFLNTDNGDLNYNRYDIVSQAFKGTHELFIKGPDGWTGFTRFTELYDISVDHTRRTPLESDVKSLAVRNFQMLDLYVARSLDILDHDTRIRVGNQVISWGESTFVLGGINWTNSIDVRRYHVPGSQLKEIFRPAPMISLSTDVLPGLGFEGYWQWKWNSFQLDPAGTYFSSADIVGKGNEGALYIPTSQVNAGIAADPNGQAALNAGLIRLMPYGTLGDPGGTGLTRDQMRSTTYIRPRLQAGLTNPANPASGAAANLVITSNAQLQTGMAIPLIGDTGPNNAGQYGLSLHYKPEWTDAAFGFYYLHYSEKIPFITYVVDSKYAADNPVSAGFKVEYPEDRQLYGVSTNFNAGDWAIGAEVSYRPREAVAIDTSVPTLNGKQPYYACLNGGGEANGHYCKGWVDMQKWQAQSTMLQIFSPTSGLGQWILPALGASEGVFLIESGVTYFPGLKPLGGIPWSLPAYNLPDKVSAGYVLESTVTYPNAFNSGFNWSPQIDWSHGIFGNSPNSIPWQSGVKAGTLTLNLNRQNRITASLAYTWFTGGGSQNLYSDRDFLGFSVGYNF